MANTITNTTLVNGSKKTIIYLAVDSDGSEETDYVVYDSSALATSAGITDPLTCRLKHLKYAVASATAFIKLEFDATTDVLAMSIPAYAAGELDFEEMGGLKNTAGTGITGDITLTTTGLAAGDSFVIILEVDRN